MDLILDGRGTLNVQLARALKAAFASGRIPLGSRVPSSRQLAHDLGLSRTTVVAAYEQLRAEGYLTGKIGSGSYASQPLVATAPQSPELAHSIPPQTSYAKRARRIHSPDIPGSLLPGMRYAFQYGVPLVDPKLSSAWARTLHRAAHYTAPYYPASEGLPALRAAISEYLSRYRGVQAGPDDILVVAGAQQAVSLAARVLLEEGDDVVMEDPQYFGAREVVQMHGANVLGVPVDDDGLRMDRFPQRPVRLAYVTPSNQFPTGAVLSLQRRMALLEYARQNDGWILEDDYDGDFRYDRKPLAALKSLDRDGRVIYIGSFSKTLFPALRLGYMIVPPGLRQDFVNAKWAQDFGSPAIEQAALAHFISSGAYERHLRRTTRTLAVRRAALTAALRACSRGRLDIRESHAGMHVVAWINGASVAAGDALIRHALAQGLGLYSIAPCYLTASDRAGLLMGFGAMSVKEIQEAVALFSDCLDAQPRWNPALP